MTTAKPTTMADKVIGKAKRVVGELTGRPDLVLEGEARDTGLPREDKAGSVPPPRKPGPR